MSVDDIAAFEGRMAKVEGGIATGKTEALVRRCATLLQAQVPAEKIAVCTTSALAGQEFRKRLRHRLGDELQGAHEQVTVRTALDFCTKVLEGEQARARTGRVPRLLDRCEYNFFLEDLKTTGIPRRRMRKILSFIYAQWAQLNPEDEWLEPGDETAVRELMDSLLRTSGSMLAQEAPTLCADWLRSDEGAGARQSFEYMLADDFQNLTRAEQTCLCLLAGKQLIVTGNTAQTVGTLAHPKGFAEFDTLRHGVETFTLNTTTVHPDIVKLTNSLAALAEDEALEARSDAPVTGPGALNIKWNTPSDEMKGMATYLKSLLDADESLTEDQLYIIVPNKRWAAMASKALEGKGIACSLAGTAPHVSGDPRDLDRCRSLMSFLRLELLADPHDMTAWRCWCGLGNYLTNSEAWAQFLNYAKDRGLSLYEALEQTSEACASGAEPFLRASALATRFDEGRAFIEKNARRTGFALARVLGMENSPEYRDVLDLMQGDETPADLCELTRAYFASPVYPEDLRKVHIATCDNAAGLSHGTVFVLGAVDGFVPGPAAFEVIGTEEERASALASQRRIFCNVLGTAAEHLVISHFSKAGLELAERTKMRVMRVRSEAGQRVALLHPSVFLEEAGAACPSTVGGQTLLAERGLI